jgi:ATP-binding cassette subfamily B protein
MKITVLIRSLGLMGQRKFAYVSFLGLSLISSIISVAVGPVMNKRVINAIEFSDLSLFYSALLLMFITTILFWVVSPIACYGAAWASKRAMFHLRSRLTEHLLRLPISYYDSHSKGEVLSLLSNDLACLESIYDYQLYKTFENFCIGFTGLIMLFVIDWRLAIAASILGFVSTWISSRYSVPLGKIGAKLHAESEKTTTVFLDILKGVRTIKLFNLGALMGQKLFKSTNSETLCNVQLTDRQAEMNAIVGLMNGLSSFGIIIIGAFMVKEGLTDWGSVIVVSGLQFATGDLFSLFPMSLANMQSSLAGVERVLRVFDVPLETLDNRKYKFRAKGSDGIALEVQNVSFGYKSDETILNNISFILNKGEITALVGESGGGKSTLVKLILGLYQLTDGQIYVNSDKEEMNIAFWRENIVYVPQNPQIVNGTITDNIAFGADDRGADEIESAAKAAGIHDYIISLPSGYQTLLTEDGMNLSGGQRQRIAIARALLRNADILLLDELTSALDGENEAFIMQSLRRHMKKRSILVITHRESTLDYADRILRLQSGDLITI